MEGIFGMPITKDFVFCDVFSNNWMRRKYGPERGNRYWTFQLALNILNQTKKNPLIVETGCQRMADDFGAGMSTTILGEYALRYGARLITVDYDQKHLEDCKGFTAEFADAITYVHHESVDFLERFTEPIDLLYLDSMDYPIDDNLEEQTYSQQHCLNEYMAARKNLYPQSLLLLDDNQLPNGGKPKFTKNKLIEDGWVCLLDWQQSLWILASQTSKGIQP